MEFERLQSAVFERQKTLVAVFRQFGGHSLTEYAKQWPVSKGPQGRDAEIFFSHARELLAPLYGMETAAGIERQLKAEPLVSTIDHHGIFGHPFFLNSNLIFSLRGGRRYLVCLPTAGVSLNNNTSWSGCVLLTAPDGGLRRFSFFPDRLKTQTVLSTESFTPGDAARVIGLLKRADFLGSASRDALLAACEPILADSIARGFKDFSSQAARLSQLVWSRLFPDAPELVYLPLERLVANLVAGPIARDTGHILHHLFFTVQGWDSVEKYFHGSLGAFTSQHKGSFLYWGVDEKKRRVHLVREGGCLADHGLVIPADAAGIAELLRQGSLYPTSLMCFLVLLYYGVTALGGFNQVNWLSDIKQRFIALLAELGEVSLAAMVARVPSDNFAESNLAFGLRRGGKVYKPTAWDLLSRPKSSLYSGYLRLAQSLTVGESTQTLLPDIYKVVVPAAGRDPGLADVSEQDIIGHLGLQSKIIGALGESSLFD